MSGLSFEVISFMQTAYLLSPRKSIRPNNTTRTAEFEALVEYLPEI